MQQRKNCQFNVILLIYTDNKPDRDRMRGILRFTMTHPEWNVLILPGHPANQVFLDTASWNPDGIITNDHGLSRFANGHVCQWTNVPNAVLTDTITPSPILAAQRNAFIDDDNKAIGHAAARFFLVRGFRHFAYVPPLLPRRWSNERAQAFTETVTAAGCTCATFEDEKSRSDWGVIEQRLVSWLHALPKPCGLLGANDDRAIQVLRICELAKISVPGQISILGVDNDEFTCTFARPSLSSIEPEFEHCGYLAAEALHHLMTGGKPPEQIIRYGNPRIVERDSTQDPRGTARIVSRAKSYISEYAASGITIQDVAAAAGVSTRTLERRFAAVGASSPQEELVAVRIALAQRLLRDTTTPIGEIAPLCGFGSDIYLKIAFKKRCGMTMREYRNSGRQ